MDTIIKAIGIWQAGKIHSLGYIVASLERLYRMEEEKAALTED